MSENVRTDVEPDGSHGAVIESWNPRTGERNGQVQESSKADVDQAVAHAANAVPILAAAAPRQRREWLAAVADALIAERDQLVELADAETALGRARLEGEVDRAAGQLRFYGEVAAEGSYLDATIDHKTTASPDIARINVPLGPVAIFGASNFPFAFGMLGNDFGAAIAAGCPVVIKAHPAHPLLSAHLTELAAKALEGAGAPDGTFGSVAGHEAGTALVQAPGTAAVAFTGSQAGGLALWRLANDREVVIPVYAEMGTVNPAIVTPAAAAKRMEEIARGYVGSFTLGQGQFCTKPGLMFAPRDCGAATALAAALREAAPAPVMLTAGIASGVERGLDELLSAGAQVVDVIRAGDTGWTAPAAVLTAPISSVYAGSRVLEECFGAVAVLVEYEDTAQLRATLPHLQGALAATVVTALDEVDAEAPALIEILAGKVGRVAVNDWPTGVAYTWAQHHGGPWPATSNPAATSVGAAGLRRFLRPVAFQSTRDEWLPPGLQAANPWQLPRRVDGQLLAPTEGA